MYVEYLLYPSSFSFIPFKRKGGPIWIIFWLKKTVSLYRRIDDAQCEVKVADIRIEQTDKKRQKESISSLNNER